MHHHPRRGVTPVNLLAAITSVGLLAALALPPLQAMREAANASACKNNLRQLALGAQNHHDQRGDMPPMGMFSGGVSWAGLLLPYMDEVQRFRRLRLDMPYDVAPNSDVRHLRGRDAAYPYLYCPSRRRPPQFHDGFTVSDYTAPSVGSDPKLDDPTVDGGWMECWVVKKSKGPFLLVWEEQPEDWKSGDMLTMAYRYRSRTSFSSLVDGASNQVFFGEKAVHPDLFGQGGKAGDFTCYSFIANDFNASGAARPGNGGISPKPDANKETTYRYWGSWHPNTCRFAMADGRVEVLSNDMSQKVLTAICTRDDGTIVGSPTDNAPIDDSALDR